MLNYSFFCSMKNIIIFASGSGSNAQTIINHFKNSDSIQVAAIFSNKQNAGVLERAKKSGIPTEVFSKKDFYDDVFLEKVEKYDPELIILAGFLLKVPDYLIKNYPNKIINIHPALLPNYGGKGMYGTNVHKAVFENKEKASGMTIHYVNEHYDQGNIIFQESIPIDDCTSFEDIALKVLTLEHKNYPLVIEKLLKTKPLHN